MKEIDIEMDSFLQLKSLDDIRLLELRWAVLALDAVVFVFSSLMICVDIFYLYNAYYKGLPLGVSLGMINIFLIFGFIYVAKEAVAKENYQEIKGEMRNRGLIPV